MNKRKKEKGGRSRVGARERGGGRVRRSASKHTNRDATEQGCKQIGTRPHPQARMDIRMHTCKRRHRQKEREMEGKRGRERKSSFAKFTLGILFCKTRPRRRLSWSEATSHGGIAGRGEVSGPATPAAAPAKAPCGGRPRTSPPAARPDPPRDASAGVRPPTPPLCSPPPAPPPSHTHPHRLFSTVAPRPARGFPARGRVAPPRRAPASPL